VVVELRSRTASTRYRFPDVAAVLAPLLPNTHLNAAFVVVEVLVPNIWLVDPRLQLMWIASVDGSVELSSAEIFAA
jgi:hypothetical protein